LTLESAFGTRFTVGIEEELLLVDSETCALSPTAADVLGRMGSGPEHASHEAFASQIELRSAPSRTAGEAAGALADCRRAASAAGATLLGAGIHPTAAAGEAAIVDSERYRRVAGEMRGLFGRTPESALHVHVGVPDADAAVRVFNALRLHLPLLQALTVNSPWWFGRDSGLASSRYSLVRAYPGRGVPPAFSSWDEYTEHTALATAAADVDDYTLLWWDIRLHPRLGTVEVREMDAQSSLDTIAAVAALVQAVAATDGEDRGRGRPEPAEPIAWSCFRAARDGLDATILHDGTLTPARDLARTTVERVMPAARDLGSDAELDGIERLLVDGTGAERQRAAHAHGGVEAMLDQLVEETAATAANFPK